MNPIPLVQLFSRPAAIRGKTAGNRETIWSTTVLHAKMACKNRPFLNSFSALCQGCPHGITR
ncbi:uncharacterized protein Dmul_02170 [Desulfococcus multivorans]|nr:uncharacterized protein Dmul_02170 [Desulfococcus multivorans]